MTSAVVLDASAVLAFVRAKPGGEKVLPYIGRAVISAVNVQEVVKELALAGMRADEADTVLGGLHLDVRPHDEAQAYAAGMLIMQTRKYGRGLGDRTCMALGIALDATVVTADREWRRVEVPGLRIKHIRQVRAGRGGAGDAAVASRPRPRRGPQVANPP